MAVSQSSLAPLQPILNVSTKLAGEIAPTEDPITWKSQPRPKRDATRHFLRGFFSKLENWICWLFTFCSFGRWMVARLHYSCSSSIFQILDCSWHLRTKKSIRHLHTILGGGINFQQGIARFYAVTNNFGFEFYNFFAFHTFCCFVTCVYASVISDF
jgi:hypothetical protein